MAYKLQRDRNGLTARERQVRDGIAAGMCQLDIGELLGISKQRVWQLVASLKKKGALSEDGLTVLEGE